MSTPDLKPVNISCPECGAGTLRLRYLAYFTEVQGELITVPNFPAWVCDMCGYREDDSRARNMLSILLNPQSGRRKPRRPANKPGRRPRRDQAQP